MPAKRQGFLFNRSTQAHLTQARAHGRELVDFRASVRSFAVDFTSDVKLYSTQTRRRSEIISFNVLKRYITKQFSVVFETGFQQNLNLMNGINDQAEPNK
jgi:hypothetical protein